MMRNKKDDLTIAITGGSGFVGTHMCQLLAGNLESVGLKVGKVRVLDLRPPNFDHLTSTVPSDKILSTSDFTSFDTGSDIAELPAKSNSSSKSKTTVKFEFAWGSILDEQFLLAAFEDVDVVIHSCSLVDFGHHTFQNLYDLNVKGTELVIKACQARNVRFLVYTSTAEVATWNRRSNKEIKEDDPVPTDPKDFIASTYGYTKALAEKVVLEANGSSGKDRKVKLLTTALRPKGVFGEGDPYYLPNVLNVLLTGTLVATFTDPGTKMDSTYVGNVAFAHLFLAGKLIEQSKSGKNNGKSGAAGEAFFLRDGLSRSLAEFLGLFSDSIGKTVPKLRIPLDTILVGVRLYHILGLAKIMGLPLSAHSVMAVSTEQTICGDKLFALGFEPMFPEPVALARTRAWITNIWLPNKIKGAAVDKSVTRSRLKKLAIASFLLGGLAAAGVLLEPIISEKLGHSSKSQSRSTTR